MQGVKHHKIFTAEHPLHQMAYFRVVWSCCNKRIWLQKKSSEKMKCVVMWLNMCCFPIERHQIRVWAVKVSFDPRQFAHTVTYMDISTSSCSLQYKLSFKARTVSVGWMGSEWLDSECKKGTYLDISSVSPLCCFVLDCCSIAALPDPIYLFVASAMLPSDRW